MSELKKYEFWFVTGAQKLYGDIFEEMVGHAKTIVAALNADPNIPSTVIYKPVVTQTAEITATLEAKLAASSAVSYTHLTLPTNREV